MNSWNKVGYPAPPLKVWTELRLIMIWYVTNNRVVLLCTERSMSCWRSMNSAMCLEVGGSTSRGRVVNSQRWCTSGVGWSCVCGQSFAPTPGNNKQ